MPTSRTYNAIRNTLFGLGGQAFAAVLGILCRTIFVRLLDENYLGINGLFANILSVLSLMELGIAPAMVYSMYKPLAEENYEKLSSLLRLYRKAYLIIALAIGLVGMGLVPFLSFFMKEVPAGISIEYIRIVFLFVLASTVISYFYAYKGSVLIADQKNFINVVYKNGMEFVKYGGQVAVLAVCWWQNIHAGTAFLLYLSVQILTNFITNFLIARRVDRMYPFLKNKGALPLLKEEKQELVKNVGGLFCHKIGGVVLNGTDNMIISVFIGVGVVGLYNNYLMLINLIKMALEQVINSITASIGNLFATEDQNHTYRVFKTTMFLNYLAYGFSFICFWNLLSPFVAWWLGDKWLIGNATLLVVLLHFLFNGLQQAVVAFSNASGIFWATRYKPFLECIVNLGVSIWLAKEIGLPGVFIGTVASFFSSFWIGAYVLYKKAFSLSVMRYFLRFGLYTGMSVAVAFGLQFVCNLIFTEAMLWQIVLRFAVCAIGSVCLVLPFVKTEEFSYIKKLLSSMLGKIKGKVCKAK
ncbi:MAG: hypothetical protein II359_06925 [Clostridia bacterium]|nr:hypothetical protein [Clostridia bacterium]